MALSIKSDEADRLARELARRQRKSITAAVTDALAAELDREKRRIRSPGIAEGLKKLANQYAQLPILDDRSEDEILGYDENGIPS